MSDLLLPGPDGSDPGEQQPGGSQADGQSRGERGRCKYPNEEECLAVLTQLIGLLVMGIIKSPQGNAIRGIYRDILQHHHQAKSRNDRAVIGDADILDLVQRDPSILNLLSPLLTDEQIDLLMKRSKGENGGTA